jgi:hydrogenase-4 component F
MAVAAVFVIKQGDFKRLLAYSSVEHMGILAIGVGIGGAGTFGALLHAINHSLTKAMLFLVAGNILALYHTKRVSHVTGALRRAPWSGALWMAGFFAIVGSPPFGTFLSEFTILGAALESGRWGVAALYIVLLAAVFAGMGRVVLGMLQGTSSVPARPEPWSAVLPPAALGLAVLVLGIYVPPALAEALELAARSLGGR